MEKRRIATEIKSEVGNFKVAIGALDKKSPTVIYIECGSFIEAENESGSHKEVLKKISSSIRRQVSTILSFNPNYENEHIFVIDCPSERLSTTKRTYLSAQLHMKLSRSGNLSGRTFQEIYNSNYELYKTIVAIIENELSNNGYICHLNKR